MPSRRTFMTGAAAAMLCGAISAPAQAATRIGGHAFGSSWRATLPADVDALAARHAIEAVVAAVDAAMSPYRPDSELSRFNRARTADWMPVSAQTCRVAGAAQSLCALTGGAYDPTVGPLVARYGFGPIAGDLAPVAALDVAADGLRKSAAGLTLDLCGIAKGHALDRAVDALAHLGIRDALVEIGGEVRCTGRHPAGRAWRVGIERPDGSGRLHAVIAPGDHALATSGHQPHGHAGFAGLSHVVDPRSGRPVVPSLASVTVLDPDGMRADALATALLVLGRKAGSDFAERHGIPALMLAPDGPAFQEITTGRIEEHIISVAQP